MYSIAEKFNPEQVRLVLCGSRGQISMRLNGMSFPLISIFNQNASLQKGHNNVLLQNGVNLTFYCTFCYNFEFIINQA